MGIFDKVTNALGGSDSGQDVDEQSVQSNNGVFDITEWAQEDRVNVEKRAEIIHKHYERVNLEEAKIIAETLKEKMGESKGYSRRDILNAVEGEVELDDKQLETIVWTEISSIETIDRVKSYLDRERGDDVYKIQAPMDNRTHPVTREAVETIEERGGAVPMNELAEILLEKAEKYEQDGGTPERMGHWVPHERFRFSITRHVDF